MAALASIPETSFSGYQNYAAHQLNQDSVSKEPLYIKRSSPRSGHMISTKRRPIHLRRPAQQPIYASSPVPKKDKNNARKHTKQEQTLLQDHLENPDAPKENDSTKPEITLLKTKPPAMSNWDPSDSSVDLDQFPAPPSNGRHSRPQRAVKYFSTEPSGHTSVLSDFSHSGPSKASSCSRGKRPLSGHCRLGDASGDVSSSTWRTSVDSALVEAISRNICQQLRLTSTVETNAGLRAPSSKPNKVPRSTRYTDNGQSQTSSQRRAVDRFEKELFRYAEHTGAKGKPAYCTPTPSRSAATLQTVSALLPFHPELAAAGLAVTAKEQTQRIPTYITKAVESSQIRARRVPIAGQKNVSVSQLDGPRASSSSSIPNTEISFTRPQDMDEWRYALVDEAPARKKKQKAALDKPKTHCWPCFPRDEDLSTDQDWAHFKAAPTSSYPIQQNRAKGLISGPMPSMLPPSLLPQGPPPSRPPPPRPPRSPPQQVDSNPSPHHKSDDPETFAAHKSDLPIPKRNPESAAKLKATRDRKAAMTVPDANIPLEVCQADSDYQMKAPKVPNRKYKRRPEPGVAAEIERRHSISRLDQPKPLRSRKRTEQIHPFQRDFQDLPNPKTAPKLRNTEKDFELSKKLNKPETGRSRTSKHCPLSSSSEDIVPPKSTRERVSTRLGSKKTVKASGSKRRSVSGFDANYARLCCRNSRGVPGRAFARPNIPRRTSSMRGSPQSTEVDFDDREIQDRDVLRGLHVAASAACDEQVDAFVRNRTGMRIRRFLADLMIIETLANRHPDDDTERQARRRRGDMRKLKQQVRRSREIRKIGMI